MKCVSTFHNVTGICWKLLCWKWSKGYNYAWNKIFNMNILTCEMIQKFPVWRLYKPVVIFYYSYSKFSISSRGEGGGRRRRGKGRRRRKKKEEEKENIPISVLSHVFKGPGKSFHWSYELNYSQNSYVHIHVEDLIPKVNAFRDKATKELIKGKCGQKDGIIMCL